MRMKNTFFMMLFLVIFALIDALKPIMLFVLVGGPFRDFKWGGLPAFRPTKDSEAEVKLHGVEFEHNLSPNGDIYSTGTWVVGHVGQECAMTIDEFNALVKLQDGETRSGTATMPNGSVVSVDAALDGELILSGGKVTIKMAGKIKIQ